MAAMLGIPTEGPFEQISPRRAPSQADALGFQKFGEGREVDLRVLGIEGGCRSDSLSQRRHAVAKSGCASVDTCGGVRDLEALGHPANRSAKIAESKIVDTRKHAVKV